GDTLAVRFTRDRLAMPRLRDRATVTRQVSGPQVGFALNSLSRSPEAFRMTNGGLHGFTNSAVASRTGSFSQNVLQISGASRLAVVRRPGALSSGLMSRTVRPSRFTVRDIPAGQSPEAFSIPSSVRNMSELRPAL